MNAGQQVRGSERSNEEQEYWVERGVVLVSKHEMARRNLKCRVTRNPLTSVSLGVLIPNPPPKPIAAPATDDRGIEAGHHVVIACIQPASCGHLSSTLEER